jgi:two-component system, OmpR family, phosphate regulon response regulator PhoB
LVRLPEPQKEFPLAALADKILVVDDEEDLADLVIFNLERNGFQTLKALNGRDAIDLARQHLPRLIVLDLMLPDVEGLEVFRTLRKEPATAAIPIVMLTARADEVDRVVGLELGADDYITKPFSPREVTLRVKAILRRLANPPEPREVPVEFGPIRLVPERFEVYAAGEQITLTSTEFKLLQELVIKRGKVLTRTYLLENVWGYVHNVTERTVDTHIKRLRQKIGPTAAAYVETIRGVGYRFCDSEVPPVAVIDNDGEDDDADA